MKVSTTTTRSNGGKASESENKIPEELQLCAAPLDEPRWVTGSLSLWVDYHLLPTLCLGGDLDFFSLAESSLLLVLDQFYS